MRLNIARGTRRSLGRRPHALLHLRSQRSVRALSGESPDPQDDFDTVVGLAALNQRGRTEVSPKLSRDGLRLFYAVEPIDQSIAKDVLVARRNNLTEDVADPQLLVEFDSDTDNDDFALHLRGRRAVFASKRETIDSLRLYLLER